jgi:hypothetical protein
VWLDCVFVCLERMHTTWYTPGSQLQCQHHAGHMETMCWSGLCNRHDSQHASAGSGLLARHWHSAQASALGQPPY